MKLHTLDISIIGAYFITVIAIGLWVSRRGAKDLDSTGMTNWKKPKARPRLRIMTRDLISVTVALLNLAAAIGPARAEPSRITVKGHQFVTAQGEAIVFRGLATSDPTALKRRGQWNPSYFDAMKSWNANIVRFALHPASWRNPGSEAILSLLDEGLRFARERDLHVIIDWHSIGNLAREKLVILKEMGFTPPGEPGSYDPITGDEKYAAAITQYCANRGIS